MAYLHYKGLCDHDHITTKEAVDYVGRKPEMRLSVDSRWPLGALKAHFVKIAVVLLTSAHQEIVSGITGSMTLCQVAFEPFRSNLFRRL